MAEVVILPKLGNSVESCILLGWKVSIGDQIAEGTVLCEAETDKTTVEVESTAAGTLLHLFFQEDDEVEVFAPIAIVGTEGEDISELLAGQNSTEVPKDSNPPTEQINTEVSPKTQTTQQESSPHAEEFTTGASVSPRARRAAEQRGVPTAFLQGTGPGGRIIERDVLAYASTHEPLTPAAKDQLQGSVPPAVGSGVGGRVTTRDLHSDVVKQPVAPMIQESEVVEIPLKGVRKIIAERMHHSIQSTAQLTLNSYADATYIKRLRERFKALPEGHPLARVSLNDMVLFAVAKTLKDHPYMNAHFLGDKVVQYGQVNLGFAVDTPKGLMVPVIKSAHTISLEDISIETKTKGSACNAGNIEPDSLQGGTFTVTNLGVLGIEHFTPVLNTPEVGILGVGAISLRPIQRGNKIAHIPHIALSLTIDHQVIDGAPAGRFLKDLAENIKNFDMLFMEKAYMSNKE